MAAVKFSDLPKGLSQMSYAYGLLAVGRTWLVIVASVYASLVAPHPAVWAASVVLIGTMQYHLSVLGHHTLHRNVVPSRALNDFLARYLVHGPLGLPQDAMRRNHMTHHRRFESEEDPERDHYDLVVGGRTTGRRLLLWWVTRFLGGEVFASVSRVLRGSATSAKGRQIPLGERLLDWVPVAIVQVALFLLLWLAVGRFWGYFAFWTLPQMTVLTGLMATRTTLEHADAADPPRRLFTFTTNIVERFLFSPFAFNFHAEHHLFPTVPAQHLPALHLFLKERQALEGVRLYPSYARRLGELVKHLDAHPLTGG